MSQQTITEEQKELVKALYESIFGKVPVIKEKKAIQKTIAFNPYKYLTKNSIAFVDRLKEEFGYTNEIAIDNEKLVTISFDQKVRYMTPLLRELGKRKIITITDNGKEGNSNRIVSFHFNP